MVERQLRVRRDLLGRRITLERCDELAAGAGNLLLALDDVHRDADRACLVGHAALHRLANPPGRVRRELEALAMVELLDGPHQPEVALLHEVEQRQAARLVALGDGHHQPEVGLDEVLARVESRGRLGPQSLADRRCWGRGRGQRGVRGATGFHRDSEPHLVLGGEEWVDPDLAQIQTDDVVSVGGDLSKVARPPTAAGDAQILRAVVR